MTEFTAEQFKEVTDVIGPVPRLYLSLHQSAMLMDNLTNHKLHKPHPDDAKTLTEKALDVFLEVFGITDVCQNESAKAWQAICAGPLPKCLQVIELPDGCTRFECKLIMAKALKQQGLTNDVHQTE